MSEAKSFIKDNLATSLATPDAVVLHTLTNDLKHKSASVCAAEMAELSQVVTDTWPDTKLVVSLATPRGDDTMLNNRVQLLNATLKYQYSNSRNISCCDNSNLGNRNVPINQFFNSNDKYHLSVNGVARLAKIQP